MGRLWRMGLGCLSLLGCSGHPDEGTPVSPGTGVEGVPGNGTKVLEAKAYPIMGGTLFVSKNGTTALASDPDRDSVYWVDLSSREVVPLEVGAGAVPGRIVEDDANNAYVVLRGAGQVAKIDLAKKQLSTPLQVCSQPRGIAFEAATGRLHVACRDGALLSYAATDGKLERQIRVAKDLRDVVVSQDRLVLTTFRSAETIVVDASGQISARHSLAAPGLGFPIGSTASVAWRAQATPQGDVHVVHQFADTDSGISIEPSGYGSSLGSCSSSIVTPAVSRLTLGETGELQVAPSLVLAGAAGPTDIAVAKSGRIAVVVAGNAWRGNSQPFQDQASPVLTFPATAATASPGVAFSCSSSEASMAAGAEPVAVAFDGQDRIVVQSREPAALYLEDGTTIALSHESRANTGLALFHMNTGSGIACASCHPEGTEDAQTWLFSDIGPRRTQMVAGGISQRAPFHWNGDMTDFPMLVDEVMVERMNLEIRPNRPQMAAFAAWVDGIERPAPTVNDPDAIARGKQLFFDRTVGCNDCHTGPALTNNKIVDVGTGGQFVVPTLIGIASRAPFIHDGCAKSLKDRFTPCGGGDRHGQTSHLSETQIDDLVVYLESL